MNHTILHELHTQLQNLDAQGLRRRMAEPLGLDFSSNDYLGFANDSELEKRFFEKLNQDLYRHRAPASRLLRGHLPCHTALEKRLAQWKGTEAALLFSSGYLANLATLSTLVSSHDRVISDALNHASLVDGIRMTKCHKVIVPHLDLDAIEDTLKQPHPSGHTFVVTESLFGMDGDIADIDRLASLCETYGAGLIVDDSHGVGVYAPLVCANQCLAVISTFGKGLSASGACVSGPQVVIDSLINRARSFIFTTAIAPWSVASIDASLDHLNQYPDRGARACALAARLRSSLRDTGLQVLGDHSPIVPVIIGDNDTAMAYATQISNAGFDVRAVRPPTVPQGTARLRISVHADRTKEEIDQLVDEIWTPTRRNATTSPSRCEVEVKK